MTGTKGATTTQTKPPRLWCWSVRGNGGRDAKTTPRTWDFRERLDKESHACRAVNLTRAFTLLFRNLRAVFVCGFCRRPVHEDHTDDVHYVWYLPGTMTNPGETKPRNVSMCPTWKHGGHYNHIQTRRYLCTSQGMPRQLDCSSLSLHALREYKMLYVNTRPADLLNHIENFSLVLYLSGNHTTNPTRMEPRWWCSRCCWGCGLSGHQDATCLLQKETDQQGALCCSGPSPPKHKRVALLGNLLASRG